jgi:hypothetical protein
MDCSENQDVSTASGASINDCEVLTATRAVCFRVAVFLNSAL